MQAWQDSVGRRSVSPISEDEVSPLVHRRDLPFLGPLPINRHSSPFMAQLCYSRQSSSSVSSSGDFSPLPTFYLEQDPPVFPKHPMRPAHANLDPGSPVIKARPGQRRMAVFKPPPLEQLNVKKLAHDYSKLKSSGEKRPPILPARYREVLYDRKLQLLEQASEIEDRKPIINISEIRKRAISEVVRPDLRRLPPTQGDITDAIKWIRYQITQLRKEDASLKKDFAYVQSYVNEAIQIEESPPPMKPFHIRYASDSAVGLESSSGTMVLRNLRRNSSDIVQSHLIDDVKKTPGVIPKNDFVTEFRERTSSLSRDKPPSILQKLLYQSTTRREEFV